MDLPSWLQAPGGDRRSSVLAGTAGASTAQVEFEM